jgi:hypothetical protein
VSKRPLERGKWVHELLDAYYTGVDWKEVHHRNSLKFQELFDEEKEDLGNLPEECGRLMRSYLWHYGADPAHGWKVIESEFVIETTFPDGSIYRGKVDLLVEDQYGLWIVDHKTHENLPSLTFRLLDAQSGLYLWAARRSGMDIQGFIWNYIRTKPPTVPQLVDKGRRLSVRKIDTDYPTMYRALKKYELNMAPYRERLLGLQRQRWNPDKVQTSGFFQRHTLEKDNPMLKRIASEAYHTHRRMHRYDFSNRDAVERVVERSCEWMCSYNKLCTTELFGGNPANIRRQQFAVGDPHDYYNDERDLRPS